MSDLIERLKEYATTMEINGNSFAADICAEAAARAASKD